MRTLLRNKNTASYFKGVEDWTNSPIDAFDFKLTERVIRFVRDARLNTTDLELVLAFDDPSFDITLAMDERFGIYGSAPGKEAPRIFS
jgi:hypothetical protein